MRKLLSLLLVILLFSTACKNNKAGVAGMVVEPRVQYCNNLKACSDKVLLPNNENQTLSNTPDIPAPLPAYSWDSKMMFY